MNRFDPTSPDQPSASKAPVLEYAAPNAGRPGRKVLPAGAASAILGAEVGLGSMLAGGRNASLLLAVPLGLIVGAAIYFILTLVRKALSGGLVIGQLVLALGVTVVVVFITLTRGAEGTQGPGGLQYWLTYNPGYGANPRWAMEYLWLAGVGVAWFAAVSTYIAWKTGKNSPCPPSSQPE
jgi:hypothetical protein